MGKLHDSIKPAHKEFIEKQHIFFVSTAPLSADGRVNLSPKGLDCFNVLGENKVGYMDLISSGNETSAHTSFPDGFIYSFLAEILTTRYSLWRELTVILKYNSIVRRSLSR